MNESRLWGSTFLSEMELSQRWPLAGAIELRNEISRAAGIPLPGTLIFDYPTVSAIAAYLQSKLPMPQAEAPSPLQTLQSSRCVSLL